MNNLPTPPLQNDNKNSLPLIIFGIILALGLIAAAFVLGTQFKNLKQSGTITVKGLAEAPYKANLAQIQMGVSAWGQDYAGALANGKNDFKALQQFVASKGFSVSSQNVTPISVEPYNEDYVDEQGQTRTRQNGYKATQTLSISSQELNKITNMLAQVQNYRISHESVTFEKPQYLLNDLEKIKHDLIAKATDDANKRAEEFAKTGNAKVGVMRSASQGSFNILDAHNPDSDDSDYGGTYDKDGVDKLVRLVVTIDYAIEQ
ncbi:SIMPL domain-containing protein [Moraxella osloensis]|nr:SIMPL domain-containing protein [Moraxella osloensis]MBW4016667.1 SIMPL domain-containing protein [Moraxella osloensis]